VKEYDMAAVEAELYTDLIDLYYHANRFFYFIDKLPPSFASDIEYESKFSFSGNPANFIKTLQTFGNTKLRLTPFIAHLAEK